MVLLNSSHRCRKYTQVFIFSPKIIKPKKIIIYIFTWKYHLVIGGGLPTCLQGRYTGVRQGWCTVDPMLVIWGRGLDTGVLVTIWELLPSPCNWNWIEKVEENANKFCSMYIYNLNVHIIGEIVKFNLRSLNEQEHEL